MKTDSLIVSVVFASLVSPFARAGDPERVVNPSNLTDTGWEHLAAGPGTTPPTFSWQLVSAFEAPGDPGPRLAPGFPLPSCSSTAVLQSIAAAASAWNNASLPDGTRVSRLALSTAPAATIVSNGASQVVADTVNKVSLWQPASYWVNLGGPVTLAVTSSTTRVPPNGLTSLSTLLVDSDIVLNTSQTVATGVPYYSFTETVGGTTFGTWPSPGVARTDPIFGYADLQGVLTHEFGHAIGLGHSLVDSVMQGSLSLTPTMFEWAQAEPFGAQSITVPDSTCNVGTWSQVVSLATSMLWGRSARSLEPDDLTAVFRGYPATLLNTPSTPGSITGEVEMLFPVNTPSLPFNSPLQPALAVSVVAVSVNDPNGFRVGTMSYVIPPASPGSLWKASYNLTLLPPGDYFVAVEPLGRGYFSALPDYASVGGRSLTPVNLSGFVAEFHDTGESHIELSSGSRLSQVATPVHVNAGTQTQLSTPIRLEASPSVNQLTVERIGSGFGPSARGVLIQNLGGGAVVSFRVSGLVPAVEGVYLGVATQRTLTPGVFGQLLQISPFLLMTGVSDAQGVVKFDVPVPSIFVYTNVFAQAGIIHANSSVELTNVVNVWIAAP